MKKYTVELTTLAQEQILEIAKYITEELMSPAAANRLLDKFESEISKLDSTPERIVLVDEEPWHSKGVRKFIIENYIAYFIILESENAVRVIAVVMSRRDQKKQLKKTGV